MRGGTTSTNTDYDNPWPPLDDYQAPYREPQLAPNEIPVTNEIVRKPRLLDAKTVYYDPKFDARTFRSNANSQLGSNSQINTNSQFVSNSRTNAKSQLDSNYRSNSKSQFHTNYRSNSNFDPNLDQLSSIPSISEESIQSFSGLIPQSTSKPKWKRKSDPNFIGSPLISVSDPHRWIPSTQFGDAFLPKFHPNTNRVNAGKIQSY